MFFSVLFLQDYFKDDNLLYDFIVSFHVRTVSMIVGFFFVLFWVTKLFANNVIIFTRTCLGFMIYRVCFI